MRSRTSIHPSLSIVEQTALPTITARAHGGEAQFQCYVNAFIVGTQETFMNGKMAIPLYYLSLVAMRGQGTILQGMFSRLVSTHPKEMYLEGVGDVMLAHHQSALFICGYSIHWNFEQAEVLPHRDLHAVIESNMLTVCDPVRGMAMKQRTVKRGGTQGKKPKERASLSSAKESKLTTSLAEIRNREKYPLFLLMVPSWAVNDQASLSHLHLSFLDLRVPWPLDPSWAGFLWERGLEEQEIEPLKVWCYNPIALEGQEQAGVARVQGEADQRDAGQVVPFLAQAYFCRPKPAQIQQDIQEALVSGRISSHVGAPPPLATHEGDAAQVAARM